MARAGAGIMSGGDPDDWSGTRTVATMETPCGFCCNKEHKKCAHEVVWFDKLWVCGCECNKSWKPVKVVVEKKAKTKDTKK